MCPFDSRVTLLNETKLLFFSLSSDLRSRDAFITQVFHTTSDQIGRLIESLSQGMDSGSFNFLPSPSPRKATFSHQQSPPPHQQGHQYLHTNGNGHGNGHAHAHSITSSVSTMNTMDREFDHLLKVVNPTQKLT